VYGSHLFLDLKSLQGFGNVRRCAADKDLLVYRLDGELAAKG
jgi:hypothetical protein